MMLTLAEMSLLPYSTYYRQSTVLTTVGYRLDCSTFFSRDFTWPEIWSSPVKFT